jgi:hypothetical protein
LSGSVKSLTASPCGKIQDSGRYRSNLPTACPAHL